MQKFSRTIIYLVRSVREIKLPDQGDRLSQVKKVNYRAKPVRETLIEMKDISELMIDLAYSSALLNNKALAEEVKLLDSKMDDLVYLLNMNLMLSARDKKTAETLAGVQRVGALTNSIGDAAGDIADLVLRGINVHSIVKEVFERTEENLEYSHVKEKSMLQGKTVDELHLARKIGADIIAIKRGEHWLINAGKEIIVPGDGIVARGTQEGLEILIKAALGEVESLE